MGKKIKLNKYIKKNQSKQIHMCKVVGRRKGIIEEKNCRVGIYYELSYIYTLHIEEVDMNKKSNVSLIYRGV